MSKDLIMYHLLNVFVSHGTFCQLGSRQLALDVGRCSSPSGVASSSLLFSARIPSMVCSSGIALFRSSTNPLMSVTNLV